MGEATAEGFVRLYKYSVDGFYMAAVTVAVSVGLLIAVGSVLALAIPSWSWDRFVFCAVWCFVTVRLGYLWFTRATSVLWTDGHWLLWERRGRRSAVALEEVTSVARSSIHSAVTIRTRGGQALLVLTQGGWSEFARHLNVMVGVMLEAESRPSVYEEGSERAVSQEFWSTGDLAQVTEVPPESPDCHLG
ncbi:MAG TPA: hypothetical protein VFH56_06455 [Acidimicrobiales bacterium]|nr:hypothetical protein [Acidimicrobiales bacterium]